MPNLTIHDVARMTGVSVSTVSRILNGKPDVAESTRQRVWQVVDRIGYIPDLQAKRLRSNASPTQIISLHYPIDRTIFDPIQNAAVILEFILGASAAVEAENFLFNLITTPLKGAQLVDLFRNAQSNGIILAQVRQDDDRVRVLQDTKYPFVLIGRSGDEENHGFVDLDFGGAVSLALSHLYDSGHRHIGVLDFPAILLEQGYSPAWYTTLALAEARDKFPDLTLVHQQVGMSNMEVTEAVHCMLDESPQISAMVAVHGDCLAGIMEGFNQHRQLLDHNLSLIAIASENQCNAIHPGLTRVDLPAEMMGYEAAQALIKQIRDPQPQTIQSLIPPQLVVGDTADVILNVNGKRELPIEKHN